MRMAARNARLPTRIGAGRASLFKATQSVMAAINVSFPARSACAHFASRPSRSLSEDPSSLRSSRSTPDRQKNFGPLPLRTPAANSETRAPMDTQGARSFVRALECQCARALRCSGPRALGPSSARGSLRSVLASQLVPRLDELRRQVNHAKKRRALPGCPDRAHEAGDHLLSR